MKLPASTKTPQNRLSALHVPSTRVKNLIGILPAYQALICPVIHITLDRETADTNARKKHIVGSYVFLN